MDKIKIARSFSRAATSYDSAAYFQRDVGLQLLSMLAECSSSLRVDKCIDIGCGTGFFREGLTSLYSGADYIGVDLAEGMLRFLKKTTNTTNNHFLVCSDAENIALKNQSVDVVFSNMAVQWCENLPKLFSEFNRVLKPGGVLGLTTLGPQTLIELKKAWRVVDDCVHVNQFVGVESWRNAIELSGLSIELEKITLPVLQFESVRQLLKELKLIGAHNVNEGRPTGLHSRAYIYALYKAYELFKEKGMFPATYEIYFFILRKPTN